MDLWTAMLTTVRRWYVTLPILVLAVVASLQLGSRIDSEWQATATVVFVAPRAPLDELGREGPFANPLLTNGNNVGTAADAVFRILDRDDHRRTFEAEGLSEDYQALRPTNSPLMDFFVVGNSDLQALDTIDALLRSAEVQVELIQQQLDAPPDQRITTQPIERSREATEGGGARLRFQAAVVLLGIVAATAGAILTESILARQTVPSSRRRRDDDDDALDLRPRPEPLRPVPSPKIDNTPRIDKAESAPKIDMNKPVDTAKEKAAAESPTSKTAKTSKTKQASVSKRSTTPSATTPSSTTPSATTPSSTTPTKKTAAQKSTPAETAATKTAATKTAATKTAATKTAAKKSTALPTRDRDADN